MSLRFRVHPTELAIAQFPPDVPVPAWATAGSFLSITRTTRELSIVCEATRVADGAKHERGWVMLELEGPFPFELTGILASFLAPLAEANVGIFAMSTYDTDFVLIKREALDRALDALTRAGHTLVD